MRNCVIMVTTASCKTISEDPETVDLATRTLETECPPQGGNAAEASPVEGCPPRQAAGCLPEGNRQATGHFQKHGQEVRRLACSAHQPDAPLKQALWKAVRHAKLQGVSLRGIARQLGISRNTVRKYVDLPAPPINRTPRRSTQSVSQHNSNGHFP